MACSGSPAHQGWYCAHESTCPSVQHAQPLQGCIEAGIEHDICEAERCHGGINAVIQAATSDSSRQDCKYESPAFGDQAAHQRSVSGSAHLAVAVRLVEHVERVGTAAGQSRAGGEKEQDERGQGGDRGSGREEDRGHRVDGIRGSSSKDDQKGEARFGEREVGRETTAEGARGKRGG